MWLCPVCTGENCLQLTGFRTAVCRPVGRRHQADPDPAFSSPSSSSTYRPKGFDVTVKYTQGSWTGSVGEDLVTITKGFNASFLVNIATIFESENFFLPGVQWNGILGLAYAALAKVSSIRARRKWSDGRSSRTPLARGADARVQAVGDGQTGSQG